MPSAQDVNFKQEVEETMRTLPGANDGQRFARAILEFAFGLPHRDAINANSCDGSLDRGLDAYFYDDEYFYLLQFKFHSEPFGRSIGFSASGAGHQLVHCWSYVSNLSVASSEQAAGNIRRELYDCAVAFNDHVLNRGKKVRFIVAEWADGDASNAIQSGRTWLVGQNLGQVVEDFAVENFGSIRKKWTEQKIPVSRYQGSVRLEFLQSEGVIRLTQPYEAVVFHVRGSKMVELYGRLGEKLFDPNVRFDLRKTEFNKSILTTASSEPANFWYYNNGITMICNDLAPEGSDGYTIEKPGIVNGGQTVKRLYEAGALSSELKVLVKVIKSTDPGFDRSVAQYTNSQNPISQRDLKSNQPEQISYQTDFANLTVPWLYERKRGTWDVAPLDERAQFQVLGTGRGRRRERRLSNEFVGKAILSFSLQKPVTAKTNTEAVWTPPQAGYYDAIFCSGRDVHELAVAALANVILDEQRAAGSVSPIPGVSLEEVKDCIPHLTAITGFLVQEKYRGIPLRADLQRLYTSLVDTGTQSISSSNFVTQLFSSVLFPFTKWYNDSLRSRPGGANLGIC